MQNKFNILNAQSVFGILHGTPGVTNCGVSKIAAFGILKFGIPTFGTTKNRVYNCGVFVVSGSGDSAARGAKPLESERGRNPWNQGGECG